MPEVELVEIGPGECPQAPELRARAEMNPWSKRRLQFLATILGSEVGFLSFDLIPGKDYAFLYELFLVKSCRGRGIGSAALSAAEGIARSHGIEVLLVRPRPLAQEIPSDWLEGWYARRGYRPWGEDPEVLAKRVGVSKARRRRRRMDGQAS